MLGEHVHASLHEIHQILCGGGKDGFWEAKNRTAAGIRYCNLTVLQQKSQTGNMATQTA